MRTTIARTPLAAIVDVFGPSREVTELLDGLERAVRSAGVKVLRPLPNRLYAYGDAAELAERARVWLVARGVVVEVRDW